MKKALSLMLALAMCVGLATTSVYAGGVGEPEIWVQITKESTTKFNPRTQTTALSGMGWNYAPDTKTLTLDNFSGEYLGIYRSGDIKLKLNGNNNIPDVRLLGAGDSTEGNRVTIIGDGSLTAKFMIISIPVVQTSATVTVTGEEGNYGREYGIFINNGDNTSFHMTGGTLNATGRNYGIKADQPQGQILLEGGTVTAQGGLAAIWCKYDTPPERSTDIFSVGGRKIVGGETAGNVRAMDIKAAGISADYGGLLHFVSLSDKELAVGEFTYEQDKFAKNSGAAKYVYIADTRSNQPTTPTEPEQPTTPTQPQQPSEVKTANPTNDKLEVNGAAADPTVYKIGGSNYFKIRDVAAVLNGTEKQFAVGYSGGKVTVTSGQPYEATGKELAGAPDSAKDASPSNDAIVIDGVETSLTVYKIGGSNYFKLRDLGKALNFYVGWESGRGVYIETDKPYSK